jgi:hypothetical protein
MSSPTSLASVSFTPVRSTPDDVGCLNSVFVWRKLEFQMFCHRPSCATAHVRLDQHAVTPDYDTSYDHLTTGARKSHTSSYASLTA